MAGRKQTFMWLLLLMTMCTTSAFSQDRTEPYPLIPYPASLTPATGQFTVLQSTSIQLADGSLFANEAVMLSQLFTNGLGKPLAINTPGSCAISMHYDAALRDKNGYRVFINPKQVKLYAATPAAMFMAIQTIRQLLPPSAETKGRKFTTSFTLPALSIEDYPVFGWRGIHLDVSRHFFSMDYVRKLIDMAALYKMNKFHFHLTDDQGWRVEIKKYPKLTTEGAWRTFNHQDSVCMERAKENPDLIIDPKHIVQKDGKTLYGGFYTQEQLRSLVAYAATKHIDIVPEIDMPGHMMAAIDAYNFLSCDSSSVFGELFSTPICPCNPATIAFAKDIFTEIMSIFPYEYIHIGGDEVERSHWEISPACQAMMAKYAMKSTAELQAWFIRQMEAFFHSKGKKLIGWDEILEGGVSSTAAIMYWRTWVPGSPAAAAKNGNKVIMSPGNPMYFSEQPDKNSLPAVYQYNIFPAGLTAAEQRNIIGAQGNLWTEYIPTEQRADYLYMPRMAALAENVWTAKKNYSSFQLRMKQHFKRLDQLQVSYRLPDLQLLDSYAFTDSMVLAVPAPIEGATIRYTTDGNVPGNTSPVFNKKLVVRQSGHLRMAAFKDGRRGDIYDVNLLKQHLAGAVQSKPVNAGLICTWFKKAFDSTSLIGGSADGQENVTGITVPAAAEAPAFSLQYRGLIQVPAAGTYTFYLTSDDASVLRIAGRNVVNNDGMHAPREKNGQAVLAKGAHPFALDFIEGGGGYTLYLKYSLNGSEPKDVPSSWFKHQRL